ncbi:MAG TPA: hypothetical protein VGK48_14635 [Terriglobia bacterium]
MPTHIVRSGADLYSPDTNEQRAKDVVAGFSPRSSLDHYVAGRGRNAG